MDSTIEANNDITIVLLGCTGSGKSATGNSILGRRAFQSKSVLHGVTKTCKRQATMLKDGRILHVIDTPGLFDPSMKPELVKKEIVRCIDMGRDGIHAVLIVVSLRIRFTDEQVKVVETLKQLFGSKIVDYMIVAFTGGDELDDEQETLDDRLASSPEALKDLLNQCGNRRIVFDNKTRDAAKKAEQLNQLLTLIAENGGKQYTYELFEQLKGEENSKHQMYDEEQIQQRIAAAVEEKLKERHDETTYKLKAELEKVQRQLEENKKEKRDAKYERKILKLKERLAIIEGQRRNEPIIIDGGGGGGGGVCPVL